MEGSALFSLVNPFVEPPISRSHYCPSSPQSRSKQQQWKAMKEGRIQRSLRTPDPKDTPAALDPPGDSPRSDLVSHLEESWPSSESTSLSTPEGAASRLRSPLGLPAREIFRLDAGRVGSTDGAPTDTSVIAKYIQRFRHAKPQSREQRVAQLSAGAGEFWWLHTSPPNSSTPDEDRHSVDCGPFLPKEGTCSNHSPLCLPRSGCLQEVSSLPGVSDSSLPSLKMGLSSLAEVSDVSLLEPLDPSTLQLQERAGHLLQRSGSSLSDPVPVSSEGVGSSPVSDPPSLEETSRQPLCVLLGEQASGHALTAQLPPAPEPRSPARVHPLALRPEEDILYQWRLRRKMEVARDSSWPLLPVRMVHSPPVRLAGQVGELGRDGRMQAAPSSGDGGRGVGARRAPSPPLLQCPGCPTLLVSHPSEGESWEPGGALCGAAGQGRGQPSSDGPSYPSTRIPELGPDGAWISEPGAGGTKIPEPGAGGTKIPEPGAGGTKIPEPGAGGTKIPEPGAGGTKIPEPEVGGIKIPEPGASGARVPEPGMDPGQGSYSDECRILPADKEQSRMEQGAGSGSGSSDVRRVLGQVISETMFSPPPTTLSRQTHAKPRKVSRAPRGNRRTPSPGPLSHPQPSAVVGTNRTPEVLAQLLEEAEESDGTEFQEDLLLQVLRQQRDWVRQQLREANERLVSISCQGQ